MPPKTWPEKLDVIVDTLKYFIILDSDSEDKDAGESIESDNDTMKLYESGHLKH